MPILKEIGFDVSYIPSEEVAKLLVGKSEEERNKITTEDYSRNYKQRNFQFRLQTRCIASFYERCFKSYKNDKCWKILIECVPNVDREPKSISGIYMIQVAFDINDFFNLDGLEKKIKSLELIKTAVSEILKIEGWDETIFESAYNRVVSENYVNKWIWKKQKNNPVRQYIAKVLCEHDIYSCDISILITDKKEQVIKREIVVKEKPDEWMFAKYFGDLKWISNKEVSLVSKEGNYEFRVKID